MENIGLICEEFLKGSDETGIRDERRGGGNILQAV
jgi:hypothetical protein